MQSWIVINSRLKFKTLLSKMTSAYHKSNANEVNLLETELKVCEKELMEIYQTEHKLINTEIQVLKKNEEERSNSYKRLALLSIHTPPWYKFEGGWTNWTISNHKKYTKKYGYANYIENGKSDPREEVWSKISALLRHMEDDKHDWYWAIDLDILIMNGDYKIEEILDDQYDLIFTRDWNWFNAGSFFIKNSEWSKKYLRKVLDVQNPVPNFFKEQAALMVI